MRVMDTKKTGRDRMFNRVDQPVRRAAATRIQASEALQQATFLDSRGHTALARQIASRACENTRPKTRRLREVQNS